MKIFKLGATCMVKRQACMVKRAKQLWIRRDVDESELEVIGYEIGAEK